MRFEKTSQEWLMIKRERIIILIIYTLKKKKKNP